MKIFNCDHEEIRADNSIINGDFCHVYGNRNIISGDYCHVYGKHNIVNGDYCVIREGSHNIINGNQCQNLASQFRQNRASSIISNIFNTTRRSSTVTINRQTIEENDSIVDDPNQRNRPEPFSLLTLQGNAEPTENEHQQCLICVTNKKNILFEPCCHLCVCVDCARQLDPSKCPECRGIIENAKKIYY